jgi:hypothetical protein
MERIMVFKGRVQNGAIVLEGDTHLAEGTEVRVETVEPAGPTLFDRLEGVIGQGVDLPEDLAEQHDHYLYGVPKS